MGGKFHVRSMSLPSRSHPTTLRIEDELNRLKTWEPSSPSCESISTCLSGLEDLHQCMDDLLSMPSTQQVLSEHQQAKCIDELLDGSVRLLDICGIARDTVYGIKEHVHALQSALRRRKGDSSIVDTVLSYNKFRKEMKKKGKKLMTELKQMSNKKLAAMEEEDQQDHHFLSVIRVLTQVNAINTSIFQSLFLFLAAPVSSSSKQTRWNLVSKLMHRRVISCEEDENVNEVERVDAALCKNSFDVEKIQNVNERLVGLESGMEGLEKKLECVFRHLIKARTSLLNIISQ